MKFAFVCVILAGVVGQSAALTDEELEFIRQNADAIKNELNSGTTRRGRK